MRPGYGGRMANIAGWCTAKCPCVTEVEKSSNGMDQVSTSRIESRRNRPCDEVSSTSVKDSALPIQEAGPLIHQVFLTIGLRNCSKFMVLIPRTARPHLRNTSLEFTRRTAGSWRKLS